MTRITVSQQAKFGEVFAPGCFDSSVGKHVPFKVDGQSVTTCELLAAEVAEDGLSVQLTLETPDDEPSIVADLVVEHPNSASFGFASDRPPYSIGGQP
jgi:phage head maturation protease